jgi:hypothetical protein
MSGAVYPLHVYLSGMLLIKYSDSLCHFYRSLLIGAFDIKGNVNEFGFLKSKLNQGGYFKILEYLRKQLNTKQMYKLQRN